MALRLHEVLPSEPPSRRRRIVDGDYFADIIEDGREPELLVFCVVQERGSPEVLFLGQFTSVWQAEASAIEFISDDRRTRKARFAAGL